MKTFKDDVEIDVDQLIQENLYYKRIHKTLSTQVQFIETKMSDLRSEISTLYADQQQSRANEQFLKNIVKRLTRIYGYENIERVIEAVDAEATSDSSNQMAYPENSCKVEACNKHVYQLPKGYHTPVFCDEDTNSGKEYGNACGYDSIHQSSVSELAQQFVNRESQSFSLQNGPFTSKSLPPQEADMKDIFNTDDSDDDGVSAISTSSKTYQSWLKDLEKKKNCAEAFVSHGHDHHMGGLDIDDLYHRTDF